MNAPLFFYLADVTGNVSTFLVLLTVVGCVIVGIGTLIRLIEDNEFNIFGKWLLALTIFTGLTAALIPSKQTIYLMAASSVVMDVAQNERVKSIADNSLTLIENKIKEYNEEGKKVVK